MSALEEDGFYVDLGDDVRSLITLKRYNVGVAIEAGVTVGDHYVFAQIPFAEEHINNDAYIAERVSNGLGMAFAKLLREHMSAARTGEKVFK